MSRCRMNEMDLNPEVPGVNCEDFCAWWAQQRRDVLSSCCTGTIVDCRLRKECEIIDSSSAHERWQRRAGQLTEYGLKQQLLEQFGLRADDDEVTLRDVNEGMNRRLVSHNSCIFFSRSPLHAGHPKPRPMDALTPRSTSQTIAIGRCD